MSGAEKQRTSRLNEKSGGSKSTTGYSGRSAKLHHGLWAVLDVNASRKSSIASISKIVNPFCKSFRLSAPNQCRARSPLRGRRGCSRAARDVPRPQRPERAGRRRHGKSGTAREGATAAARKTERRRRQPPPQRRSTAKGAPGERTPHRSRAGRRKRRKGGQTKTPASVSRAARVTLRRAFSSLLDCMLHYSVKIPFPVGSKLCHEFQFCKVRRSG